MCENTKCDFPFGYEDLQFISADEGEAFKTFTSKTKGQMISNSIDFHVSKLPWSETDILKQQNIKQFAQIMKESGEIHEINELSKSKTTLKNRKYIKNLPYFQEVSRNLHPKHEELDQFRIIKTDFDFEKGETKLNIELGTYNTISSINLDIADKIK